MAVDKK